MYLGDNLKLEPTILIELIKEAGLKISETLIDIAVIHSSYISIINEETANGREDS